jgi:hypothetical protein
MLGLVQLNIEEVCRELILPTWKKLQVFTQNLQFQIENLENYGYELQKSFV